jgi:hypothetical protein
MKMSIRNRVVLFLIFCVSMDIFSAHFPSLPAGMPCLSTFSSHRLDMRFLNNRNGTNVNAILPAVRAISRAVEACPDKLIRHDWS